MKVFVNRKNNARMRRLIKIRRKMQELNVIRLVVHRTSRHIYAQVISSTISKVLVCASTLEKNISKTLKYTGNKKAAAKIGSTIAKRALEKGICKVAFDRSGFKYHGRIQALAESARQSGLQF